MRVLITGGAGYIGSHAAKEVARRGHEVVVLDNLSTGHRWAAKFGPLIEGDVGDTSLVQDTLSCYGIDLIMHFAAHAYVGESMANPRKYFRNNVVNALALFDAMLQAGVRRVVFSSTCATYGVPESVPITEGAPQHPINPYGESKLFVEKMLAWYGKAYGLKSVALRYFNAAGADPEGELGEAHDPETHLIPLVLDAAAGAREIVDIYGTDYATADGTAVRDYIHVSDLARAHLAAAEYLLGGGETVTLNLGTGHGYSVREVVAAVERVSEHLVPVREMARRPGDPPVLVAQPTKAKSVLGWSAVETGLDEIVRTAWDWHQSGAKQAALLDGAWQRGPEEHSIGLL